MMSPCDDRSATSAPFPIDVLPSRVASYVTEAATAIGCDACYVALPLLACLARAIGNKRTIKLKRDWQEPAIIWGAIVGRSGTHKTPALKAATSLLARRQTEALADYEAKLPHYEQELALYQRDLAAWKRNKSTTEPPPWEPQRPVCERYVVSDITVEALADRLSGQFDGVLVVRDELAGWIDGMAQYKGGRGSDAGHWLASWSAAPLTVDRKTGDRKTIHIPRAAVSIIGGIQPGILERAIGREHLQDGLCARLLLVMPEQRPIRWTEQVVSPVTEAALRDVFDRLLELDPAADEEGRAAPFAIPLTLEAKQVWVAYYNRHRAEMIDLDEDLTAAWSKLEAYTARFALIIQLCTWAAGAAQDEIDETAIRAAMALSDWFGDQARRIYGLFLDSEKGDQQKLVQWIQQQGGTATVREVQRNLRAYRYADDAEAVLTALVNDGLGAWEHVDAGKRGGRPTRVFRLADADTTFRNPAFRGVSSASANRRSAEESEDSWW